MTSRPPPDQDAAFIARARALIARSTAVEAAPLTPELRFHTAADYSELWSATEAELEAAQLPPPFWAFAWPGGQALARFLLDHPEIARGRRVLALGAGAGLEAIAAAKTGAAEAISNDIDPAAAVAAEMNAALNGAAIRTETRDRLADAAAPEDADVVLLGDAYYEHALSQRLDAYAARAAAAGRLVLIAGPERPHPSALEGERLAIYDVPVPEAVEDAVSRRTEVRRATSR